MLKKVLKIILIFIILVFAIGTCKVLYHIFAEGLCTEYTNIKHYQDALNIVREPEGITHFPHEIPKKAKNIKFYSFSGGFYHQRIFLEFDSDKNYIDNEIKRLNLLPPIKIQDTKDIIAIQSIELAKSEAKIDTNKYTYYAIDNNYNRSLISHNEFPFFSGIGINKDKTQIFYYFVNPEG